MLYVNIEQTTVTAVLIRLQYLGCSWSSCIISVHIRQRGRSLVRQPYLGYAQTWIQDSMLQDQEQDQDFQNTISRPRSKSRELHVWLCIKKNASNSINHQITDWTKDLPHRSCPMNLSNTEFSSVLFLDQKQDLWPTRQNICTTCF